MQNNLSETENKRKNELQIPIVFKELLNKRGFASDEAKEKFLFPLLSDLPRPALMHNLERAVGCVIGFIESQKKIVIWGDYDVDGTTGTALLVNFFKQLLVEVIWHIPDRLSEGYGLNASWFITQKKSGVLDDFLVITVDCGTSDAAQVEIIQKLGGTVIVTDHHSLPDHGLPDCIIVNPSQPQCGFYGEHLAGVGVAFYLAAGIRFAYFEKNRDLGGEQKVNLKQFLAFVALGTVADVVQLTSTNRILVRAGMEALNRTCFIGLQELLASCGIVDEDISSEDIGYLIAPKINAAGRLGKSNLVVDILTDKNRKHVRSWVAELVELNNARKKLSAENLELALGSVSSYHAEFDKCLIIKGNYHQGVAGIVASRLVEIYNVPSIVFAKKIKPDGSLVYSGSARSVEGINIVETISMCSELLERFGGHSMAAGLTVREDNYEKFYTSFIAVLETKYSNLKIEKKELFDVECSVEKIMSKEILDFLQFFEPFGPCNLQPLFYDSAATIVDTRLVGKNSEHLHLTIRGKTANLKAIGFNLGEKINDIQRKPERAIIYSPTRNRFRGNISWQVRVVDI